MSKRSKSSFQGAGPSQRQLRVGEEVRHIISQAFARGEFYEEALKGVTLTIPEVQVSPDLRHARVYVYPIGGSPDLSAILDALNALGSDFRTQVARQLTMKYVPRLRFCVDSSFEEAAKIEGLLRQERVLRDLEKGEDPSDQETDLEAEPDCSAKSGRDSSR